MIVTFDLFSALTDTRRGATATLAGIVAGRGCEAPADQLYDDWDRRNKQAQASAGPGTSFRDLSRDALASTWEAFGVAGDPVADADRLLSHVGDWPLWPDVADGLPVVAGADGVRALGLLSNVDDDLVVATRAYRLVDPAWVLTSESLGASKPDPEIYRRALRRAGDLVHVASSARDVRGALEAGIRTIRLVRPGHRTDPDGPAPGVEVDDVRDVPAALARLG
jgi:2-haloacid dehalogenase